VEIGQKEMFVW